MLVPRQSRLKVTGKKRALQIAARRIMSTPARAVPCHNLRQNEEKNPPLILTSGLHVICGLSVRGDVESFALFLFGHA